MALTEVKEWSCPECSAEWVCCDVESVPIRCPFCNQDEKPPRPGGIKPIRPPVEEE